MISMKKAAVAAVCTTVLMASTAMANETYICKHGDQERTISVVYTNEGSPVPCEVTYTKDSSTESLWRADNMAGYCEEKATSFVEQQRAWGWDCTKQEAQDTVKEEVQNTADKAQSTPEEVQATMKEETQSTKEKVLEKADDAMKKAM